MNRLKPHNILLCNRCDVEMVDGKAFQNQLSTGMADFPGMDINSSGQTLSYSGPPKMVKVKKCPKCGRSIKVA